MTLKPATVERIASTAAAPKASPHREESNHSRTATGPQAARSSSSPSPTPPLSPRQASTRQGAQSEVAPSFSATEEAFPISKYLQQREQHVNVSMQAALQTIAKSLETKVDDFQAEMRTQKAQHDADFSVVKDILREHTSTIAEHAHDIRQEQALRDFRASTEFSRTVEELTTVVSAAKVSIHAELKAEIENWRTEALEKVDRVSDNLNEACEDVAQLMQEAHNNSNKLEQAEHRFDQRTQELRAERFAWVSASQISDSSRKAVTNKLEDLTTCLKREGSNSEGGTFAGIAATMVSLCSEMSDQLKELELRVSTVISSTETRMTTLEDDLATEMKKLSETTDQIIDQFDQLDGRLTTSIGATEGRIDTVEESLAEEFKHITGTLSLGKQQAAQGEATQFGPRLLQLEEMMARVSTTMQAALAVKKLNRKASSASQKTPTTTSDTPSEKSDKSDKSPKHSSGKTPSSQKSWKTSSLSSKASKIADIDVPAVAAHLAKEWKQPPWGETSSDTSDSAKADEPPPAKSAPNRPSAFAWYPNLEKMGMGVTSVEALLLNRINTRSSSPPQKSPRSQYRNTLSRSQPAPTMRPPLVAATSPAQEAGYQQSPSWRFRQQSSSNQAGPNRGSFGIRDTSAGMIGGSLHVSPGSSLLGGGFESPGGVSNQGAGRGRSTIATPIGCSAQAPAAGPGPARMALTPTQQHRMIVPPTVNPSIRSLTRASSPGFGR